MEIVSSIKDMQKLSDQLRLDKKQIGFVPTMGALHEGHLSLMKQAKRDNDVLVISIFVNPIQFGEDEDYESYPKNLERDKGLALAAGVEIIFQPGVEEMYSRKPLTFIEVKELTDGLCGSFRPGHFQGVATVAAKLFNIVKPHRAYFGQKDFQQACVIKKMVQDLNFDLEVIILPIVRDKDGLALSSRNAYLNQSEKKAALVLYQSLIKTKELLDTGNRESSQIISEIKKVISTQPLVRVEYISVVDSKDLTPVLRAEGEVLIALAVRIGHTRLIDNILWEETKG